MKKKSNVSGRTVKEKSSQKKSKKSFSSDVVDKGYYSVSDNSEGYIFANTPLNMEDEERNPDCC